MFVLETGSARARERQLDRASQRRGTPEQQNEMVSSAGHRYEAIGGETHCGVRGGRRAGTSKRRRDLLRVSVPCGAVFCLLGLWVATRSNTAPGGGGAGAGYVSQGGRLFGLGRRSRIEGKKEGLGEDDAEVLMQVLVTNKYQRDDDTTGVMYPWEHVAEPVRDTRLEILSWPGRDDGAGLDYMYVSL